jgi:hypothetical protein
VRKLPDGHVDIDGNIRMPNKGHMFAIETCGRHCEVLVEYTEAPKVSSIQWHLFITQGS